MKEMLLKCTYVIDFTSIYLIIPAPNLVSPVSEALRNKLAQVNWGRNDLGLPLVNTKLFFILIINHQQNSIRISLKVSFFHRFI